MTQIDTHATKGVSKMLIANKCDMDTRVVTEEQGKELAAKYSVPFFETSAKSGFNIKEVFEEMAREIIKNKPAQP